MTAAFPEAINWSDLQRDPTKASDLADAQGEVTIKRRGRPDLTLIRADRQSEWREFMSGTAQLLRNLINHGGADVAAASLIELYPWLDFLPPAERQTFVREFVRTLQGTADVGVPNAITRFIHEWRATAAVYANPELHAILADREAVGDFGPAMAPEVTDAWQE
jgi:hypothetical protein